MNELHRAIAAAEAAAPKMAAMGSYQRKEVLEFCVASFKEKFEDLAMSLCIEAGKPIKVGAENHQSPLSISSSHICKKAGILVRIRRE